MSSNVLPTAPAYEQTETQTTLYPNLPTTPNAENFRLTEISKYLREINTEIEHYRLVLKKYKKVRKVIHYSVVSLGAMTTVLSSGAVATSLTGIGALVGVPLGSIAIFQGEHLLGFLLSTKNLNVKLINTQESMLWLWQNMTR